MAGGRSRSAATVLVTDMDNTLFDWLEMWQAAFGAMLDRLIAESGLARETMGRSPAQDPLFFGAALAGGSVLAELSRTAEAE